jgi:rhamnose transport system permease protein
MTVLSPPSPTSVATKSGSSRLDLVLKLRELGIILALVALVAATTIANPRFLSTQNLRDILLGASILALLAIGQAVVVVTRNIDLSVGSVLGLSAFGTAALLRDNPGLPIPVAMLYGMAIGAACGLINALVVKFGKVPALVATLGTLYVFRGVDYFWASGAQVNAADMPREFLRFGSGSVLGIPYLIMVPLIVLLIVGTYLGRMRAGRDLYAIGSSPEAAELAGVRTGRRLLFAFVLCGTLAGLGGVLYAARYGTVDASAGSGLELQVVAAVVVGGVAIFGGSGSVYGAALGALLLTTIGSALPVLGIDQFWQRAIIGALILVAIVIDRVVALRVAASLRRRDSHGS